jgi:hypothetical protein
MIGESARRALSRVSRPPELETIMAGTVELDGRGGEVLVARVRPKAGVARRCSRCQRRAPVYDTSAKLRR